MPVAVMVAGICFGLELRAADGGDGRRLERAGGR